LRLDRLVEQQKRLASLVRITKHLQQINTIAGADVARRGTYLFACIGVFSYPDLQLLATSHAKLHTTIPYVPGFLSYRELPVMIRAYRKLEEQPDVIIIDGQGIAHPRGLGLASHFGITLNVPTIGCAKSHLFGKYEEPRAQRGAYRTIRNRRQPIGIVLRTRDNVKPVYVSPGHLVDFGDCLRIVLRATRGFRLPEPVRYAHRMAGIKASSAL